MALILTLCADSPELTIGDDWLMQKECSSSADSIMIRYVDSSTNTTVDLVWDLHGIDIQVMEVRLECYPADRGAAGGIDQVIATSI